MGAVKAHEAERALGRLAPDIRVVLLYGPDQGLVSERAVALAKASVEDPEDPFQLVRLDGAALASDPMRLADEANTIGMFGGRRAIRVAVGPRPVAAAVEPLLKRPPQDAMVILEAGDLQRSNPLRALVERAEAGLAVPCYPDEARGVDALIDPILREHGLEIDRAARTLLISRLGADRQLSRREIEKLALYARGEARIETAHVEACVGDAAARDIDMVIDAAFTGKGDTLDQGYARLRQAGEDPGVLIGFALRHALMLLGARAEMDRSGRQPGDIVAGLRGVPYPRRSAIEAALRRSSVPQLTRLVGMLEQNLVLSRRTPALAEEIALRALWNLARA